MSGTTKKPDEKKPEQKPERGPHPEHPIAEPDRGRPGQPGRPTQLPAEKPTTPAPETEPAPTEPDVTEPAPTEPTATPQSTQPAQTDVTPRTPGNPVGSGKITPLSSGIGDGDKMENER